ncbi:hypothetical protein ACKGJN_07390 [Gillisia sp. Q332]|uniref:hypothetical protein n=1 Tax=Gillisia xinjiangensis TaxID=3384765 RepID=UPI003919E58F
MKIKFTFYAFLALGFLSSCASDVYYQVYKAEATGAMEQRENALIYEDDNSRILYNLWKEGGNIGFQFYNKTDEPISLHLNKSFFILNEVAHDYYLNRVTTYSNSSKVSASENSYSSGKITGLNFLNLLQTNQVGTGKAAGASASSGKSISYQEEEIIVIPAGTSKIIMEHDITDTVLRNCNLILYPKRKEIQTQRYSATDTPLDFSNRITYSIGRNPELIMLENKFYVSEIANYPEKEITVEEYEEFCGEKSTVKTKFFEEVASDKFFLRYEKGNNDSRKH